MKKVEEETPEEQMKEGGVKSNAKEMSKEKAKGGDAESRMRAQSQP